MLKNVIFGKYLIKSDTNYKKLTNYDLYQTHKKCVKMNKHKQN